jgi:hypothetical protein
MFAEDLSVIESSLYLMGTRDNELRKLGLGRILRKIDSKAFINALDSFSENLVTCIKVAPFIDKGIADRLNSLLLDSRIEDLVTRLAVRVKLAEHVRQKSFAQSINSFVYFCLQPFFADSGKSVSFPFFADKSVSLENVISAVARLKVLVKMLSEEQYQRESNDDEVFKPSNININIILTHVDQAIEHLTSSQDIRQDEKKRLTEYLQEIKAELANETPSWKKIIGALIICATLLSGMADAPQVLQSLNSVLKYILGTSVEKSIPSVLPPNPPLQDKERKDVPKTIST